MDLATIIGIVGLLVAVAIGGWQIILARKQLKADKSPLVLPQPVQSEPIQSQPVQSLLVQAQPVLPPPVQPPFPQSEYKLSPTPEDIVSSVGKLPPFQREVATKSYSGIKIQWHLALESAASRENPMIRLTLRQLKGIYPLVFCEIDTTKYPEVKIMHEKQPIWVAGKIEHVNNAGLNIELSDVQLSFDNSP